MLLSSAGVRAKRNSRGMRLNAAAVYGAPHVAESASGQKPS
jgi:hypothetical protein